MSSQARVTNGLIRKGEETMKENNENAAASIDAMPRLVVTVEGIWL